MLPEAMTKGRRGVTEFYSHMPYLAKDVFDNWRIKNYVASPEAGSEKAVN
jgi:hypothetical protein